jgi:rare lipoprotein A
VLSNRRPRVVPSFLVPAPVKLAAAAFALAALGLGGCAQQPQQLAAASHGKEYFPSSKYGAASRRVIVDGQPIPRGGGQYLVGKPYTVAGQTYYPSERRIVQVGNASWYGDAFHGRLTANGEIYDKNAFTAAHPTMPLPSYARVTNLRNNSSMIVRVNDRGPYASNRVMDVSGRVAEALDFKRYGTAKIKVEYVGRASLAGSDDARLFATLRTDGPARWQGESPTMVAEAAPPARVASLAPYVPETRVDHRRPMASLPSEDRDDRSERVEASETPRRHVSRLQDEEGAQAAARRDAPPRSHRFVENHERELAKLIEQSRPSKASARDDALANARSSRFAERGSYPVGRRDARGGHADDGRANIRHAISLMPPSRPMDLGTIPGAASQIGTRHHPVGLRLARSRDD